MWIISWKVLIWYKVLLWIIIWKVLKYQNSIASKENKYREHRHMKWMITTHRALSIVSFKQFLSYLNLVPANINLVWIWNRFIKQKTVQRLLINGRLQKRCEQLLWEVCKCDGTVFIQIMARRKITMTGYMSILWFNTIRLPCLFDNKPESIDDRFTTRYKSYHWNIT